MRAKLHLFGSLIKDELILGGLVGLSCIGVALTDMDPTISHWYWLAMVPIVGLACLSIEWSHLRHQGMTWARVLRTQILYWGALLVAVQLVYLLVNAGRINFESAGLVILLLLALTTFVQGIYADSRFCVVGLFLGLSLVIMTYVDEYLWILLVIGVVAVAASYALRRVRALRASDS
jgi:hypothetical protein